MERKAGRGTRLNARRDLREQFRAWASGRATGTSPLGKATLVPLRPPHERSIADRTQTHLIMRGEFPCSSLSSEIYGNAASLIVSRDGGFLKQEIYIGRPNHTLAQTSTLPAGTRWPFLFGERSN